MSPGRSDRGHDDEVDGIWNVSIFKNPHRNDGSIGEIVAEDSVATPFRRINANYSENACSDSNTVRHN